MHISVELFGASFQAGSHSSTLDCLEKSVGSNGNFHGALSILDFSFVFLLVFFLFLSMSCYGSPWATNALS